MGIIHEGGTYQALVDGLRQGLHPTDLPVENYDTIKLALNLRTAREIGLTIPPAAAAGG